jgi:hypothetical protein
MKLSNFDILLELRDYLRDYTPSSYLTNYAVEAHKKKGPVSRDAGEKTQVLGDFTSVRELE